MGHDRERLLAEKAKLVEDLEALDRVIALFEAKRPLSLVA